MKCTIGTHQKWLCVRSLVLLSVLAALMFPARALAQSQSTLLDQGIYAEDSLGDLDKAIELYEQILTNDEANRVHAAQAQYRVGVCYTKKGLEKDAAGAFRKVVDRYPDQPELVAQARARLANLGFDTNGETLAMSTRQIWAPALDTMGAPSPDGRYIVYVNWDKGNLAVHDIETGENRDLTDEGTWDGPMLFSDVCVWSPDSSQIAYMWISKGDKEADNWGELRIVGLDGSEPRVLSDRIRDDQEGHVLWPRDWSRDGKYLLGVTGTKNESLERDIEFQITLVSVADGSERILKSLGERMAPNIRLSLSPDGRYVAFDLKTKGGSEKRNICLLDTYASPEADWMEIEHPDDNWAPFWTPDGKSIIFTSDRSVSNAIWMLDIEDGKPNGTPTLIKGVEKTFETMGITQDGSLYYTHDERFNFNTSGRAANNIFVATVDFQTGEILDPPKKVSLLSDSNNAQRWSHDGKYLAYASHRRRPQGMTHLMIWSAETGEEREIKLNTQQSIVLYDWSPDGRSVLCEERKYTRGEQSISIHLIDIQTGDFTTIMEYSAAETRSLHTHYPWMFPRFLKNGKDIYYVRDKSIILTYNLETHEEKEIYRSKTSIIRCSWPSPDGRRLAIVESQTSAAEQPTVVRTILTSNGEPGKSLYASELRWLGNPKWTSDGDIIIIQRASEKPNVPDKLSIIPVEGGATRELELRLKLDGFVHNPDGRRLAFARRDRGSESQIWALENFLPESTAGE